MIKIRVSYERPEELQRIKKLLPHGHVKPWKESSAPDGSRVPQGIHGDERGHVSALFSFVCVHFVCRCAALEQNEERGQLMAFSVVQ